MHAVLLSFDHLPLSLLGCYGASWNDTPAFDRLARCATTFDACFAEQAGWLADGKLSPLSQWMESPGEGGPSWLAALKATGTSCEVIPETRFLEETGFYSNRETLESGAAALQRQAQAASSFTWIAAPGLTSPFSAPAEAVELYLDEFFDEEDLDELPEVEALQGTEWLERLRFPRSDVESSLRRSFAAAAMAVLDRDLGEFFDRTQLLSPEDDRLLIVAGLAGDLLMEHPLVSAGMPPLVDETIHVPLWIRTPDRDARGTRRGGLTAPGDVAASLLEWAAATPAPVSAAAPLVSREGRVSDGKRTSIQTSIGGGARALRMADAHAVYRPASAAHERSPGSDSEDRLWFFTKPDDVWDLLDVAAQVPDRADELRQQFSENAAAK